LLPARFRRQSRFLNYGVMAVKGHRHCSLQYEIWNRYFAHHLD